MENKKIKANRILLYCASGLIWICIWEMAARGVDNEIFLPRPKKVICVLFSELIYSEGFRNSLINSILHIGEGFIIGSFSGVLLAILASVGKYADVFLWFPIKVIKTVPVASFVILALLWADAGQLSVIISAMIVLPTLYINTKEGIKQTDKKLVEMADLYRISVFRRLSCIYVPSVLPYILSACSVGIGMAWKAGIAAEIIGMTKNSIGNELYKAKLYLMIPELFAWTIVIVVLSVICEIIIKALLNLWRQE